MQEFAYFCQSTLHIKFLLLLFVAYLLKLLVSVVYGFIKKAKVKKILKGKKKLAYTSPPPGAGKKPCTSGTG